MKLFRVLLIVVCCVLANALVLLGQSPDKNVGPFDKYGAINAEDASARLDNLAIQLQNQPNATAFVVAYGPTGNMAGTANHVLHVTRDYLVKSRGIDANRIQIINAGRFKNPAELFTELWLFPAAAAPPQPQRYEPQMKDAVGKFAEADGWDESNEDGCCGPTFGNPALAAFADLLREQPKSVGYIVAFSLSGRASGTRRRVARRQAVEMRKDGIAASRIRIVYGGRMKANADDYAKARLQYWILPPGSAPPVKKS